MPVPRTESEKEMTRQAERTAVQNQRAHDAVNFSYLDMYEEGMVEQRKA